MCFMKSYTSDKEGDAQTLWRFFCCHLPRWLIAACFYFLALNFPIVQLGWSAGSAAPVDVPLWKWKRAGFLLLRVHRAAEREDRYYLRVLRGGCVDLFISQCCLLSSYSRLSRTGGSPWIFLSRPTLFVGPVCNYLLAAMYTLDVFGVFKVI